MIDGVKIELSTAELQGHIIGRASYHDDKAAFYEAQIKNLSSGGVSETFNSNDPIRSLQASLKEHKEKAGFFRFLADHLITNETYRLSENDLARLEIVSRYY